MLMLTRNGLQTAPSRFWLMGDELQESINSRGLFWMGRAATALYYAYLASAKRQPHVAQPEVIVPSMMCATASNTAYLAGLTPRFADIDPATGLMTLEHIQAVYTPNTVAVVLIHLLGNTADSAEIARWCHQQNLYLIEDPTQALGAVLPDGQRAGSVGDYTVYSFNRTKIIEAGNGALLANTPASLQLLEQVLEEYPLPEEPDAVLRAELGLSYRNLHHSLVSLLRSRLATPEDVSPAFMAVRHAYASLFLKATDPTPDMNHAWMQVIHRGGLQRRLGLATQYAEALQVQELQLLDGFQQSGVCWRFSFLVNQSSAQVAFSEAIRKDGFHVSNLYWSVPQFFNPADICPHADDFSRRIVNVWVDESVDADYVARCSASILRHIDLLR